MLSPKYFLYLALGPGMDYRLGMSSNPKIDAYFLDEWGFAELWVVQPPLPLWLAEKIYTALLKEQNFLKLSLFQKKVAFYVSEFYSPKIVRVQILALKDLKSSYFEVPRLESIFWGKCFLGTEVPGLLKTSGYDLPWDPEDWMQALVVQSKLKREAAVTRDVLGLPYCRRCGSTEGIVEEYCLFCGSTHCLTCYNCQRMGVAKSCIPLYFEENYHPGKKIFSIQPRLDVELTLPQRRAIQEVEAFYQSAKKRFLVWAVCGSGKTEVSFGVVSKALSKGENVLFAIPRKDIVIELLPRFSKAFPGISIIALYGGSEREEPGTDQQLTIATTHQCLWFYHRFDLIILDEADAFPYQGSGMLHYAVERALKPDGKLIIMTATPSRNLIEMAESGKLPYVSIPARYHRKPLVVPELLRIKMVASGNSWEPPERIDCLIRQTIKSGRKLLIFLPTIRLIETVGKHLVEWGLRNNLRGDWTHSRQENRVETKQYLNEDKLDFLVTSTIFERGITIRNLDVMVLFADYEMVFDSRTLVQIAGRVGRYGETASVVFVAKTVTKSIKDCSAWIRKMNQEAKELGFLD